MCELTRKQKHYIRKRDAKRIKLTGKCALCGNENETTSRHHLYYDVEKFRREAVIEVCNTCDDKIHQRNKNDSWLRELKAVRTIELIRDPSNMDEYIIMVDDQKVGNTHKTIDGIKLSIRD